MITTAQLYSQLVNGLVKNTKFSDLENNKELFRRCATRAVTELHTLFNIQEQLFAIQPINGKTVYALPPYWLNINSCVTSEGDTVTINNPDNPYSIFINAFNQIQIPTPIADVEYIFSGRYAALNLYDTTSGGNFENSDLDSVRVAISEAFDAHDEAGGLVPFIMLGYHSYLTTVSSDEASQLNQYDIVSIENLTPYNWSA